MRKSVAAALPGYNWQVEDTNWISIVLRQDGCIVIFNDEGICEYIGATISDFLWEIDLEKPDNCIGPLPDEKPNKIIKWDLGSMPGKESPQPPAQSESAASEAKIVISHIEYDGAETRTEADEYVEITNQGMSAVDISGWQLQVEGVNKVFTFPQDTVVAAAQSLRVYTNQIHEETGGFSFNSKRALWHNRGDVGRLADNKGELKFEYKYGNKATT